MKTYCKAKNKQIIDQFGQPLFLKGVGIGGWLLLEGYMIKSFQTLDRPRRINEYIADYVGEEYATYFRQAWVKKFFQKKDIQFIKDQGFNCIRIPLDYQFLFEASMTNESLKMVEEHAQILDQIISECKKQKIYVILDLHAAPGGQTGTNIDNSEDDLPRLFLEPLYQKQTIDIWTKLARRYKEEEYIVAYDLLNEPLPNWFSDYNDCLLPFYQKIISAIRQVDPHHMITLEGLHWSTDLSIFRDLKEDNILLQFHKYWSNPDMESIKEYLDLRKILQAPLIMGEGGENNLLWYSAVFKLYQQLDISYVFWTYKKMDTNNSPISFKKPDKWEDFLKHTLSRKEAKAVLDELLHYIEFDASHKLSNVTNHILRKDTYILPAYAFDYSETSQVEKQSNSHDTSLRKQEGLKIATSEEQIITPNFKQYNGESVPLSDQLYLFLDDKESVQYTFDKAKDSTLTIDIICSDPNHIVTYMNGKKRSHTDGKLTVKSKTEVVIVKIKAINKVRLAYIDITTKKT